MLQGGLAESPAALRPNHQVTSWRTDIHAPPKRCTVRLPRQRARAAPLASALITFAYNCPVTTGIGDTCSIGRALGGVVSAKVGNTGTSFGRACRSRQHGEALPP